jgi:hypothetical protein
MRLPGLAVLLTLSIPAVSGATLFHVRPDGGSDTNNGISYSNAFQTISRANVAMQPGDVCYLWPGIHSGIPNPTATATNGGRFTFIGAGLNGGNPVADTLSRATILVPGGRITQPYVTLKGVTVAGDLELSESADRDSILSITCTGSWSNQGGDYNVYANSVYQGPFWNLNKATLSSSVGVKLFHNDFPYLGQGVTGAQDHIALTWNADSTVEMFDRKLITVEAGLDNALGAEWHFDDRHHQSRGNTTHIHLNRSCYAVWRWRSDGEVDIGSFDNRFDGDVIVCDGETSDGPTSFMPSSSANCGASLSDAQCVGGWGSVMDSCVIDASGTTGMSQFYFQGGMHDWQITRSVIAMNGSALNAFDVRGTNVVEQCTLSGIDTVEWTDEYSKGPWSAGAVTFHNNIVNAWSGNTMTFARVLSVPNAFASDYNVFWQGSGGAIPRLLSSDPHSVYGDALFVSPGLGAGFDCHLRAGSPALGLVPTGIDAGAYQCGNAPVSDASAPAVIQDLKTSP